MKRILCPTDFSETANNAVEYAAMFAKAKKGELHLYHARPIFDMSISGSSPSAHETVEEAADHLQELSKSISKKYAVPCYPEVEPTIQGVGKSIGDKTADYDIVIMGTNGGDDISRVFQDSNAYKAVVRSHVPMLIIPKNCRYATINDILLAFDYGAKRRLPIRPVELWVEGLIPNVTVLQVLDDVFDEEKTQAVKTFETITLRKHEDTIKSFKTVYSNDTAQAIHNHVLENGFDALALCTVERNFVEGLFHKSVIKHICAKAEYPVFVFEG